MIDKRHWLPHGGVWISYTDAEVMRMDAADRAAIHALQDEYDKNRLSMFLPHSGGRDFLNDWTNDICMLTAPTRTGKSAHGTAWTVMRGIPTDKRWPIFADHGVQWHEFRGPRKLIISSYSWDNVAEVYLEYLRWLPRYELGPYAPEWGKYEGETGRQKALTFGDGRPKRLTLTCGSELIFLCDGQSQAHWEGKRFDDAHFDEQREREKFIGWLRGTSNTDGMVQGCFTLTGHILEGRPDTGAGGWIKRELWDGAYTFGKKVGRYRISMEDVPECVLPAARKAELRKQWVDEPKARGDIATIRKGEARFFGGWETGSGLVLDNFQRRYHLIPRFSIPKGWTLYRGLDHGREAPMAALWMAVAPWGDQVFYREYYMPGRTIPFNAKEVAKASGSTIELMRMGNDVDTGSSWPVHNEVFHGEHYFASVMDTRSFTRRLDERNCTMGQFYNDCGLTCTKSTGFLNEVMVPRMNAKIEVDHNRPHIMIRLLKENLITEAVYKTWLKTVDGNPNCGSRQYFFSDLRHTIEEIEGWRNNSAPGMSKDGKPMDKDDHLMSAWRFIEGEEPRYAGDYVRHITENEGADTMEPEQRYKYVGS